MEEFMNPKKISHGILLLWMMAMGAVFAENNPQAAYEQYVQSVKKRNLESFAAALASGGEFYCINSRGKRTESRQEYLDEHRQWFKETNWDIDFESPLIVQRGGTAYTMAVFHYRETEPDGKVSQLDAYFTLILVKEEGEWKAVADVITPIIMGKNDRTENDKSL
jgi:ketosteroid isomerase-like protein